MTAKTVWRLALALLLAALPLAGTTGQSAAAAPELSPPAPAFPATGPKELVVSTAWLAAHLADPDLVLLHVGDRGEYDAGHLPGARLVDLRDVSLASPAPGTPGAGQALRLEMLPAEELRRRLAGLGISDASRIVVYFGNDWVSLATRLLFTLDYAGLGAQASLLDGGQPAWVRAGHKVTAEAPAPRTGKLSPLALRPSIVDASFVLEHRAKPGFALIDARDSVYYDGVERGGPRESPHRAGHIAGARSLPYSATTSDDLHLLPANQLRELFAAAGVAPGDVVIAYCHIGQQATAVLFAARRLGHEVRLYDGSFEEWSRLQDPLVERRAEAAKTGEKTTP